MCVSYILRGLSKVLTLFQLAVWPDETLTLVSTKLEIPATSFSEFEGSSIKWVYTSSLYTCAWLDNGSLYWW